MSKNILHDIIDHVPNLEDITRSPEAIERANRAKNDFTYFCEYYLSDYFYCKPARYQEILYDVIQNRELNKEQYDELLPMLPVDFRKYLSCGKNLKGIVDAEPREHGKSTRMTFAYPLWMALTGRSKYQLIISSSKSSAVEQMESIKDTLENNEKLNEDFGEQYIPNAMKKWAQDNIILLNGCAIRAAGKGGSLRGARYKQYRPDLIIVDDTLKDEEADSSVSRRKVKHWFNKTVQGLSSEALIVVVNTITHDDDLASSLLNDIAQDNKVGWLGLRFSAERPDKTPLWPERYSWQNLKDKEKNIGTLAYAQEFLSRPMNDEDRIFKTDWIQRVRKSEVPDNVIIYGGIDPATGAHDQSALVTIAKDKKTKILYVLNSSGKTESTHKFTKRIIESYRFYRHRKIYMEQVAFQAVYKEQVITEAYEQGVTLPIKGVNPGRGSKIVRMMALSPLVENGLIKFVDGNEMLTDQLVGFPTSTFDDLCDALYYAVSASKRMGGPSALVYNSERPVDWRKELNI